MRRYRHGRCQPLQSKKLRIVLAVLKSANQIVQDELLDCQVNNIRQTRQTMKTEELQTIAQAAAQALGTGSGMVLGESVARAHALQHPATLAVRQLDALGPAMMKLVICRQQVMLN